MSFKPETLAVLAERPYLSDLMQECVNPPAVKSRNPDQVEWYMGDSTQPVFLYQKGQPLQYVEQPDAQDPYVVITVADDEFISMVIEGDVIFDYGDLVDLPDIDLSDRQQQLGDIEARVAQLNRQIEEAR